MWDTDLSCRIEFFVSRKSNFSKRSNCFQAQLLLFLMRQNKEECPKKLGKRKQGEKKKMNLFNAKLGKRKRKNKISKLSIKTKIQK